MSNHSSHSRLIARLGLLEVLENRDTPSSATFAGEDRATGGTWTARYGAGGYTLAQGPAAVPSPTQITANGEQDWTWASGTADPRALAVPGSAGRLAACWYSSGSFTVDVDLPDGASRRVSGYFLDWDNRGRTGRVEVLDWDTGAVLDRRDVTAFQGGAYLSWDVTGDVRFRVTNLGGDNAVMGGVFLDAVPPTGGSGATFVGSDAATQGTWAGRYGAAGYTLAQDATALPSGAAVAWAGQQEWLWTGSTADPRALQRPAPAADRLAATWYGSSFTAELDLAAGGPRRVSAYFVDWDARGRVQRVEVLDAATGAVRDTREVGDFAGGRYLTWDLSGRVRFRVTNLAGPNAVVSGLFFDGTAPQLPAPTGLTATAPAATSVNLAWVDNATTETGYRVERSPDGTTFTTAATLGANATAFTDTGLAPATTYHYRVRAFDAAGASGPAAATVTTPARVVTVGTTGEFRSAVSSATPGTTILLRPGTYQGDNFFANVRGEPGRPVVIGALDPLNKPVFSGGGEALHFSDVSYLEVRDLVIERAAQNGINIDDWGTYDTPSHHVVLSGLVVRDVGTTGNQDGIKLSGVRDFRVVNATITRWGGGGSGIDMVGCHDGVIEGSFFSYADDTGATAIQAKGGSSRVVIRGNRFEHAGRRAVQIGGSTGLNFFRPQPPAGYEATEITVERNVIIGSQAAVVFASSEGSVARFNTIYRPTWYAIRILQENTNPGFVPTRNGVFADNIVAFRTGEMSGAVNAGAGTDPASFQFARNWWYSLNNPAASRPTLPSPEVNGTYGVDPQFADAEGGNLRLRPGSPASGVGAYA